MNLFKIFTKEKQAVGLSCFRDKKEVYTYEKSSNYNINRQIFTANYTKNFFLM